MTDPCSKGTEIEKLLTAVFGNGEPGMRTDIALIKKSMDDIAQKIESSPSSKSMRISSFLGGFVAVSMTGISIVVLKLFGII